MKRLSPSEYKRIKALKQEAKSIPEKETKEPLLESSVSMRNDPFSINGYDALMTMVLIKNMATRHKRR